MISEPRGGIHILGRHFHVQSPWVESSEGVIFFRFRGRPVVVEELRSGIQGRRIRGFEGARASPEHGSAPSHCQKHPFKIKGKLDETPFQTDIQQSVVGFDIHIRLITSEREERSEFLLIYTKNLSMSGPPARRPASRGHAFERLISLEP